MKNGLSRLKALAQQTQTVGDEMKLQSARFQLLMESESPRAVSAFQLFQTPEPIAAALVRRSRSLVDAFEGKRLLEPSAGLGRIYRAFRAITDAPVTLVENAPQCAAELYRLTAHDDAATLVQADFLSCDASRLGGLFDVVVMNPPFKNGADIRHCRHALTLVRSGGAIVALCYAGPRQRAAFENRDGWTWELLPAGSFKAEGTMADVAMIWKRVE